MAVPPPKDIVLTKEEVAIGDKVIARQPLTSGEIKAGKNIMGKIAASMESNFVFNQGDEPPFGYFHPELEGKLKWLCCEDKDGHLTSLFTFEAEETEKDVSHVTIAEAKHVRDELVKNGWLPLRPPKMTFTTKEDAVTKQHKKRF
jgi:hypothetical protein